MADDEVKDDDGKTMLQCRYATDTRKMYVAADQFLSILAEHVEADCYCGTCDWLRHVLLPGVDQVVFEMEASHGLEHIPVRGRRKTDGPNH